MLFTWMLQAAFLSKDSACLKVAPGKLSTCTLGAWNGGIRERFESPMKRLGCLMLKLQSLNLVFVFKCLVGLLMGVVEEEGSVDPDVGVGVPKGGAGGVGDTNKGSL